MLRDFFEITLKRITRMKMMVGAGLKRVRQVVEHLFRCFSQIVFGLHFVVVFLELEVVVFAFVVGDRLRDRISVSGQLSVKWPHVDLVFVLVLVGFFVKSGFIEFDFGLLHRQGHIVALSSQFLDVHECVLVVFAGLEEFSFRFFARHLIDIKGSLIILIDWVIL